MALTFSFEGCKTAASDLNSAATKIGTILNEDLANAMAKVKSGYESNTATELYAFYDKMKAQFPGFINAVKNCSTYLSDVVAPSYEKVETTASSKIG